MKLQLDFFEVNEMKTSKKKQSDPVKVNLLADKLGVPETALDRKIRRLQRSSQGITNCQAKQHSACCIPTDFFGLHSSFKPFRLILLLTYTDGNKGLD